MHQARRSNGMQSTWTKYVRFMYSCSASQQSKSVWLRRSRKPGSKLKHPGGGTRSDNWWHIYHENICIQKSQKRGSSMTKPMSVTSYPSHFVPKSLRTPIVGQSIKQTWIFWFLINIRCINWGGGAIFKGKYQYV